MGTQLRATTGICTFGTVAAVEAAGPTRVPNALSTKLELVALGGRTQFARADGRLARRDVLRAARRHPVIAHSADAWGVLSAEGWGLPRRPDPKAEGGT